LVRGGKVKSSAIAICHSSIKGKEIMETSFKSGTSAGVRKAWLARKRGAGRFIAKVGNAARAFAGRVKANPGGYAKRAAKVVAGAYIKKFGKRLIGSSYRSLLKGNIRKGATQNIIGNRVRKYGTDLMTSGFTGKEEMMCDKCGKNKPVKGGKYCADCMSKMSKKELTVERESRMIRQGLEAALREMYPSNNGSSCWLSDVNDEYVIIYMDGAYYAANWDFEDDEYTIDDKSKWIEVMSRQIWEPVFKGISLKAGTSAGAKKGWAHRAGHIGAKIGGTIGSLAVIPHGVPGFLIGSAVGAGLGGKLGTLVGRAARSRAGQRVGSNLRSGARTFKKNLKYGTSRAKKNLKFGANRAKRNLKYGVSFYKENQSQVFSYKDAENNDCFVLVAGGSYQDSDGQWIKRDAYDKWIASLKSNEDGFLVRPNGEEVVYRWWHVGKPDPKTGSRGPGVDLGKFNFIQRVDNFVVAAGKYDSKELAEAFAPVADEHGSSIGFFHPASQPLDGEYDDIDGFEISALPKAKASFPYTAALN